MQLSLWTYEGPPHVGAMRVATAMKGLHYVLHAPQGDTYADLLFTMIERLPSRPPVTYTTFQARDLGKDTAEIFQSAAREAYERFKPQALIVGASCTAELIQDDPGGLAAALELPIPVVPLELPSYQRKEHWGASETFYQLVRHLAVPMARTERPSCNLLGPTALGFRHRDDLREVRQIMALLGIEVNVVAPLGATPNDLTRLGAAHFNVVLYPETAQAAASWMQRSLRQPFTRTVPIGVRGTEAFIREVAELAGVDPAPALEAGSRASWYSRSVDSTYLTGKRVFIFGDATHAVAAARVASAEMGFEVVGLGTYNREFAREVREAAKLYGIEPLITDDYLEVEAQVAALQPELVLGTQMERHIAKRLGVPCAVISAPVHVQDFPARHSPQMGFEGANVLFDTWVQPLMMGLEEHLLTMFREDFEFHEGAAASHLGRTAPMVPREAIEAAAPMAPVAAQPVADQPVLQEASPMTSQATASHATASQAVTHSQNAGASQPGAMQTSPAVQPPGHASVRPASEAGIVVATWAAEAEAELKKIPFFVRGKARRNTERFASERGVALITVETLYDAKSHFGR